MRQRSKKADSGKDAKEASEGVAEIVPPQNDAPVWLKLDIINPVIKQAADCFKARAVNDWALGQSVAFQNKLQAFVVEFPTRGSECGY